MEETSSPDALAVQQSLESLAQSANQYHELAHNESLRARELVVSALSAAIQCGRQLNEAKGLIQHGEWIKWLEVNCPKICRSTATRYMRLASSNVAHVQQATGLRKAYLLADIIQEPKKAWRSDDPIEISECETETINSGELDSNAGDHDPDQSPLDPMDGKSASEFDYDAINIEGAVSVEFLDGENRQVYDMAAQGFKAIYKWACRGDKNTAFARFLAVGWVLGAVDDEKFDSFPSQHNLAIAYGIHPTGLSRAAAEFTKTFDGIRNRAQSHGDGVRK